MVFAYKEILILITIYIFILGICIGSFLNVVIYRVPAGISIAKGRSFCPVCHHQIRWYDNIPLISWLCLRCRCRDCHAPISPRYPTIELLTGIMAVVAFFKFGFELHTITVFAATSILICIAWIDWDTMTIPNGLVLSLFAPVLLSLWSLPDISLTSRVLGFFIVSIPMFLCTLAIPGSFGGGDIKLIAVCGLLLGWSGTLLAVFAGIVTGGFYGIYLLASGKIRRGEHFAFGPFLVFGVWLALHFGVPIIRWYTGFFPA